MINDLSENFINKFDNLSINTIDIENSLNLFISTRKLMKTKIYEKDKGYIHIVSILMDDFHKKSVSINKQEYINFFKSLSKNDIIKIDTKKYNNININFIYLKRNVPSNNELKWRVYFNLYTLYNKKKNSSIIKEVLNNEWNNKHINNKINIYSNDKLKYKITNKLIYKNIKKNNCILKKYF